MATAAEPQPASLPFPGGESGATVRVHPLLTGTQTTPPAWLHREPGRRGRLRSLGIGVPKDEYVEAPIVAFLVEHPGAGPILIDTGLHPSAAVDPRKSLGRPGAYTLRASMRPEDAVAAQLRSRGIEASDIRLVVMTHLHIDHASGVSEFPNATFVVTDDEWEAATRPRGWRYGYRKRQFDHAFDWRLVDFDSAEVDSYATFGRSYDLLGDGSIRIVSTPGHTPGHLSVILRTSDREILAAGDAVVTTRTLREGILTSQVADAHRFSRSVKEIRLFEETRADALVIPGHDMAFWKTLDPVYE